MEILLENYCNIVHIEALTSIDIARKHKEEFKVVGLSVGSNLTLAYELIEEFNKNTYVTYIFPEQWDPDKECLFAVNSEKSEELLNKYIEFVNINFNKRIAKLKNI